MIKVTNLSFQYDKQNILHNINLEIKKGSFVTIIGTNGSGKTTLAKHLNGLLIPTSGNVLIEGMNTKKNQSEVKKLVGFVFQNFEDQIVYPTVPEDIAFGLENLGIDNKKITKIIQETAKKLNIQKLLTSNVNTLSLGQKQLVALAGILAMQPQYIVLDEPTTMLDTINKKNTLSLIKTLNQKEKKTIIMITNSLDDLAYSEHVIILRDGHIIFNGKKDTLNKKILTEAKLYV